VGSPSSAVANGAVTTSSNSTTLIASDLRTIFNPSRLHQDDCTRQHTGPEPFRPGQSVGRMFSHDFYPNRHAMGRAEIPVGRCGEQGQSRWASSQCVALAFAGSTASGDVMLV
jgi:hypothetical protein